MRIQELLEELVQTQRDNKQYNGILKGRPSQLRGSAPELGRGSFSVVRADRKDPHMIKKSNHTPIKQGHKEGFEIFIDYIIEHKLQDNIHFPRVYGTKKIKDKGGRHISKYQIEKLIDWDSMSRDEYNYIRESCFDFDGNNLEPSRENACLLLRTSAMTGNHKNMVKLESLAQACSIVGKISREYNIGIDIYPANVMFRRTPHGLQLVLADPLFTWKV